MAAMQIQGRIMYKTVVRRKKKIDCRRGAKKSFNSAKNLLFDSPILKDDVLFTAERLMS